MSENPPSLRIRARDGTVTLIFRDLTALFPMDAGQTRKLAAMLLLKADIIDPPSKAKAQRGSRIDPDWQPDAVLIAWTAEKRPDINIPVTRDGFVDFWVGKAGKDGVKLDWAATWRNWCRNQKAGEIPRQQPVAAPSVLAPDAKRCLRCSGTGHWYPRGFSGGVAPCRDHEWGPDEPEAAPAEVVTKIEDYVRKVGMR